MKKYLSLLLILSLALTSCGAAGEKLKETLTPGKIYQKISEHGDKLVRAEHYWGGVSAGQEARIDREEFEAVRILIVNALYDFREELEDVPIGEYWKPTSSEPYYNGYGSYSGYRTVDPKWNTFTKKNVKDEIDGYIKIHETWHSKEDLIMYSDGYDVLRDAISERLEAEGQAPEVKKCELTHSCVDELIARIK